MGQRWDQRAAAGRPAPALHPSPRPITATAPQMGCFGPPPADPRVRLGAWGARVALARPDLRAPGERPPAAPEAGPSGRCLGGGGGDRVAVVGLSAAGKTSILQLLSPAVRRRQRRSQLPDPREP